MIKTIDLEKVMKFYGLPKAKLAALMFPENKYTLYAIDRVINGESELNATQLSRLAHYVGLSVDQLYTGAGWEYKKDGDYITFNNGDYEAILDTKNWITKIYSQKSMFHESIIHSGAIELSKYLEKLNSLIKINKENEYYKY